MVMTEAKTVLRSLVILLLRISIVCNDHYIKWIKRIFLSTAFRLHKYV